jgi:hypothetical protein
MRLLITTDAEIDGFAINTTTEWSRGDSENIDIEDPGTLNLETPVYVDSYYFCLGNAAHQVRATSAATEKELGIFGTNMPVAPNQVFAAVEDGETTVNQGRLFEPRSVIRDTDRTFIIADTYNDRVLQIDEDQTLVNGVGSINYQHGSKLFPIAASMDKRSGILYIVWSKPVNFKTVNVSRITMQTPTGAQQVRLVRDSDKIMGRLMEDLTSVNAEGQVMPVHLSSANYGLANQLPSESRLLIASDAVTTGIDTNSVFYSAIQDERGIALFVGNFAYIDGLFSPTWAQRTDGDGFLIANAKVAIKEHEFPSTVEETISKNVNVSSIVELDSDNAIIYAANLADFSPFVPGRVERIGKSTLLIGGMRTDGQESTPDSSHELDFRTISGSNTQKRTQRETLNQIFFGENGNSTAPFVGIVMVYDTDLEMTTFRYTSAEGVLVSDVDIDPTSNYYVIAESSFDQSGRIIKVDGVGNIVYSYGEGLYTVINDVNVQIDGAMVVST